MEGFDFIFLSLDRIDRILFLVSGRNEENLIAYGEKNNYPKNPVDPVQIFKKIKKESIPFILSLIEADLLQWLSPATP